MKGGVTMDYTERVSKKKFFFLLKELRAQIKIENDEIERNNKSSTTSAPKGNMKYLGR